MMELEDDYEEQACMTIGDVIRDLLPEGYAFLFMMVKTQEVEATMHTVHNVDDEDAEKMVAALYDSYNSKKTLN